MDATTNAKVVISRKDSAGFRSVYRDGKLVGRCERVESTYAVNGRRGTFFLIEKLIDGKFVGVRADPDTELEVRAYFAQ